MFFRSSSRFLSFRELSLMYFPSDCAVMSGLHDCTLVTTDPVSERCLGVTCTAPLEILSLPMNGHRESSSLLRLALSSDTCHFFSESSDFLIIPSLHKNSQYLRLLDLTVYLYKILNMCLKSM